MSVFIGILAATCLIFGIARAQDPPPNVCETSFMDSCYETAIKESMQLISENFHNNLGQLCGRLTDANSTMFSSCGSFAETCSSEDPWKKPIEDVIGALCSETNVRIFSTPLVPSAQCFHVDYAFECISKSLNVYSSLTDYIRSFRNKSTCRRVVDKVRECAVGVFDICHNSEALHAMKGALLSIADAALNATGCDAIEEHDESGSALPRPSECQTQMTRITACLKDIVSPNTVAGELLEKIRTRPQDFDATFCRTYESVLHCKSNMTSSSCYSAKARAALAKNIDAFSKARSFLCANSRKKLLEFADSFQQDGCNPNDDVINECSRDYVRNVTSADTATSMEEVHKSFRAQMECIRKEFSDCKEKSPARLVSEAFLDEATAAFLAGGGASHSSLWQWLALAVGVVLLRGA
ncbi:hypothetical protein HPB47_027480 [Ixodes persulcatus]|uniref:Uncharacterized protein n=1 Tax=Ixodes persulcatus TaxID=34615 RepID=A0AC60PX69_IXOPE|nr:hypothetical protein HPB47_027480 [Ixodes persulcatus]